MSILMQVLRETKLLEQPFKLGRARNFIDSVGKAFLTKHDGALHSKFETVEVVKSASFCKLRVCIQTIHEFAAMCFHDMC